MVLVVEEVAELGVAEDVEMSKTKFAAPVNVPTVHAHVYEHLHWVSVMWKPWSSEMLMLYMELVELVAAASFCSHHLYLKLWR